jgi:WD40 repeat protein
MINTEFKTYLWKHLYKWHWATPLDYNQEQRIFTHFDSVHDSFIYQAQLEQNWKTSKFRYAEYQVHSGDGINSIRVVSDDELDTEQCLKNIYSIKQQYGSQRKNAYHDLSFEANGNHAIAFTASDDGTVKIHDIYGLGTSSVMKQHVQTLGGMTGRTSSLDFKPRILDKVVIAGGYDKSILMWDFMTSFLVHRFVNAHDDHVLDVCLVDAISFASSSANDLKVFDTNSKQVIKEYKNGYEKIVTDKKELFSQIACGASTGGVHIYDIRSSSAQAMITLAPTTVTVHAGSPVSAMQWCGNQFFKCTKSGLLECFDIRRGKTPFMNDFSSNGDIRGLYANGAHTITACKSGAIVMSSATTGKFINKIYREGHRQNLQCMNVSAKVMVTGGLNGVMSVHDFTKVETVVAEPLSEDTLSSKRNITPKQSCRQQ